MTESLRGRVPSWRRIVQEDLNTVRTRPNTIDTNGQNPTQMRDIWCWAVSAFSKSLTDSEKRLKQLRVIQVMKTELEIIDNPSDLHLMYCINDMRPTWTMNIARELYPSDWPTLGVPVMAAAAYGFRWVELLTRNSFDLRDPLPKWIGEWAIW